MNLQSNQNKFDARAATWDQNTDTLVRNQKLAEVIKQQYPISTDSSLLDFGAGTGGLTMALAPFVKKITAVDISAKMLEQLRQKANQRHFSQVETWHGNIFDWEAASRPFDGIVSSMTLHHIENIPALLRQFHQLLKPGGLLAIADLDQEDGTFHTDAGEEVAHWGFDRDFFSNQLETAGFKLTRPPETIWEISRDNGQVYPVFLMTAEK